MTFLDKEGGSMEQQKQLTFSQCFPLNPREIALNLSLLLTSVTTKGALVLSSNEVQMY
jgi:hypothetical protein